jgi:hypothetical protein
LAAVRRLTALGPLCAVLELALNRLKIAKSRHCN